MHPGTARGLQGIVHNLHLRGEASGEHCLDVMWKVQEPEAAGTPETIQDAVLELLEVTGPCRSQ